MRTSPEKNIALRAGIATAISALAIGSAAEYTTNTGEGQPRLQPLTNETGMHLTAQVHKLGAISVQEPHGKANIHAYRPKPLPLILRRIGSCESAGSVTAKIKYHRESISPTSSASGGFQFLDTTWNHFYGYSRAKYAPPIIQNMYAKKILHEQGTTPWNESRSCWD